MKAMFQMQGVNGVPQAQDFRDDKGTEKSFGQRNSFAREEN